MNNHYMYNKYNVIYLQVLVNNCPQVPLSNQSNVCPSRLLVGSPEWLQKLCCKFRTRIVKHNFIKVLYELSNIGKAIKCKKQYLSIYYTMMQLLK